MPKIIISILIVLSVTVLISQKLTVQLTLADDGGGGFSDGPSCDATDGGSPTCTNPQATSTCGDRFRILTSSTFGTYVNISPSCPIGEHGCMNDCTNPSPVCVPDSVAPTQSTSPTASTPVTTTPGSPNISTFPICGGSVQLSWQGLGDSPTDPNCGASTTGINVYRREVDPQTNAPIACPTLATDGCYQLVHTMGYAAGWQDTTTLVGHSYQYKVVSIISGATAACNKTPVSAQSGPNKINACPSVAPPASTVPASQTPAASTAPSTQSKYVCHTVNNPNTGNGNQLQLQTLKCEYVNN